MRCESMPMFDLFTANFAIDVWYKYHFDRRNWFACSKVKLRTTFVGIHVNSTLFWNPLLVLLLPMKNLPQFCLKLSSACVVEQKGIRVSHELLICLKVSVCLSIPWIIQIFQKFVLRNRYVLNVLLRIAEGHPYSPNFYPQFYSFGTPLGWFQVVLEQTTKGVLKRRHVWVSRWIKVGHRMLVRGSTYWSHDLTDPFNSPRLRPYILFRKHLICDYKSWNFQTLIYLHGKIDNNFTYIVVCKRFRKNASLKH